MNEIIKSWELNAEEWIKVIEGNKIPSRMFTKRAILNKVLSLNPDNVVDIGCGEGWLSTCLMTHHKSVTGVDAIQALVDKANTKGKGKFYKFTFHDIIINKEIPNSPFDMAVFNFSIYNNDQKLVNLLRSLKVSLNKGGKVLIQTLHPYFLIKKKLPYESQVMQNSWEGLNGNFTNGHSWYARTFNDWITVFHCAGLQLVNIEEILNETKEPFSVIFELDFK